MLVTLGSNVGISGGASQTFQYACNSFQKLFIRIDDDGTDADDAYITVQIGNEVICNDIRISALGLISLLTNGGGSKENTDAWFASDFGSHVLDPMENLYVTVRASVAITAVDVSAIVNESGVYQPLKYTNYSDKVFTDSNTLSIYAWSSSDLDDDDTSFTVRNQAYSATPQVQSGVNVSKTMTTSAAEANRISVLAQNQVPMNTSVNFTSTAIDGVVCVSAMDKAPSKSRASAQAGRAVISSMTASERKSL
tara:strand:- start:791 stop:1546 length:756 start_codon:yes stop_codon:yes gene_type:complete